MADSMVSKYVLMADSLVSTYDLVLTLVSSTYFFVATSVSLVGAPTSWIRLLLKEEKLFTIRAAVVQINPTVMFAVKMSLHGVEPWTHFPN
jgi:hypothetical protein